jgi:hypothetical protein
MTPVGIFRRLAIGRLQHRVACLSQDDADHPANGVFILHDKYRFGALLGWSRSHRRFAVQIVHHFA